MTNIDINPVFLKALERDFQDVQRTPAGSPQRKAAIENVAKKAAAAGLDAQRVDTLKKYLEQPGKMAELIVTTIDSLAKKKSENLIDLQRQWSNAFMRQGDAVANMAGLARTIATIASLFGAKDFADMLNAKADEELAKAEIQYARGRDKMKQDVGTSSVIIEAIKETADRLENGELVALTQRLTHKVADGKPVTIENISTSGAAPTESSQAPASAKSTGISWKQFKENMASVGINAKAQQQMETIFDKGAKFEPGTKQDRIDGGLEVEKLLAGIKKTDALTAPQKDALYKKLNLYAPEPSPS